MARLVRVWHDDSLPEDIRRHIPWLIAWAISVRYNRELRRAFDHGSHYEARYGR